MNTAKMKALSLLLIFSLFVGIIGVVNADMTYAASKKIHLKKTSISLVAGKTYQQKLIDKNGKIIKATKVKWKSTKTSVAKINNKGKITAVKSGTAKMTAKYNGQTYKFTVKVKTAPTHNDSIKFEPSSLSLKIGETKTVKVITDNGCQLTWNWDNTNAEFEGAGWIEGTTTFTLNVTGMSEGTTKLTLYDSNYPSLVAILDVTVTP